MLLRFNTRFTFYGSTRRRMRKSRATRCFSTWVWAACTCRPSSTRVVKCPLWNFSTGRALANLSAGFFRFAAFLKKIILGPSRCTPSSKEISYHFSTSGSTLSLPLKSPPLTWNWFTTGIVAQPLTIQLLVDKKLRVPTFAQREVFKFWLLSIVFQVSKIIILAKKLIPTERTGVYVITPLKFRTFSCFHR
jgi:hypothetical protein